LSYDAIALNNTFEYEIRLDKQFNNITSSDWSINLVHDFSYASKIADNAEFG